ncbi:Phosphoacetylglucosamine mutase [Bertholletia excelsa]
MNERQKSILLESSLRFSPPPGVNLSYGTAGFRADASLLQSTVYRDGILAALRSLKTQSVIGLMITASHNKVSDNGVKVADPSGGILSQDWEPFSDAVANAPDSQHLVQLIDEFVKKENIPLEGARPAEILLGRDTRPSGVSLLEAAKQGISTIVGAIIIDMGVLTTPQLHWMVHARNKGTRATEVFLVDQIPKERRVDKRSDKLIVDGANGVGGEKLERDLDIEIHNSGKGGALNEEVGADYVQKEKVVPRGFDAGDVGMRCASLDGDAERLIYFCVLSNVNNKVCLVDGDKILSLFAVFIKEQLSFLNKFEGDGQSYQAHLGVVQTAYANGASTDYLKRSGLEVVFTPTGVKYLHEKATDYDVGIYFVANGHGTILFSDGFLQWLHSRNNELALTSKGSEQQKAALRLLAVSNLINQAMGDALSGLLLVEAILRHMDCYYCERRLLLLHVFVKVVDRTAVITTNAETVVVKPLGIQEAINDETAKYPQGRCFIRPSGTEDVIRVYAEATAQEAVDNLANSVAKIVDQFLGFGRSL